MNCCNGIIICVSRNGRELKNAFKAYTYDSEEQQKPLLLDTSPIHREIESATTLHRNKLATMLHNIS